MFEFENVEIRAGQVQANGLKFSYLEAGEGPLVLALHGFPDIPRTFRYQIQSLANAGYRIVAPYQRGYSPTDIPPKGPYESAALVQDVLSLMDALTKEPVILMGHDWGAVAAYGATILAPTKVRKLITLAVPHGKTFRAALIDNPVQQRRSWYMFFFQMPFAEIAVAHNDFAFLDRLWQDWSPGWQPDTEELRAVKDTFSQPCVLQAALSYYRDTFNSSRRDSALEYIRVRQADAISVPALYIHGAKDGCVGVETTDGMENAFSAGLDKQIIKDAGHFVHQEKPEEVNRLILSFIK